MKLIPILFAAALAVMAAACTKPAGDPEVVRIGLPNSGAAVRQTQSGVWGVAVNKGFLAEEFGKDGPQFKFIYLPGNGVALNEALASRQLDFATYGGLPEVIGLAGGNLARMVVAGRSINTFYLGVKPDSPIRSADDLKGRSITIQKGNISHHKLALWLKAHGYKEGDVKLVSLAGPEGLAAFAAGQVDAVWSGYPVLAMRDKGVVRIAGSTADGVSHDENISLAGMHVSPQFEKANPELTARIVKVLVKSYHWMSLDQNRAEYIALESKATGYPSAYYEAELTGPMKRRFNPTFDPRVTDGFRQIVDFAADQKLIRAKPSLDGWFAAEYQAKALKDLGLEGYWPPEAASTGVQ